MAEIKNLNNDELKIQGRLRFKGSDGTLYWGGSGNSGRLTWDTGKVDVLGLSGQALSLGSGGTTNRLYINTSGNVGIGTTSPGGKLSVFAANGNEDSLRLGRADTGNVWRFNHAGADLRMYNTSSSGSDIIFGTDAGGNAQSNRVSIGTASPQSPLTVKSNSTSAANSGFTLIANGSTDIIAAIGEKSTNGGRFHLYDAGVEKVAFYSDGSNNHISAGNVGIGTTSPNEKLEVSGSVRIGDLKIQNANGGRIGLNRNTSTGAIYNSSYGAFQIQNNGSDIFEIQSYTSGGTYSGVISMKAADGNVGIGTVSPSFTLGSGLEIEKSGTSTLRLQSSGSHASEINQSTSSLTIADLSSGLMIFKTGNVESMRINSSGDVGIGTTSPGRKLHISDDNDAPLRVESTDPTTGIDFKDNNNSSQLFYVGGSDHFYIPSGTSLGVGASSPTLGSMLRVYSNQTTADENVYGSFFDFNTTGSDTITANRTQAAVYVDADSSTTGGSTASGTEHRFYGIYSDTRASGDSDYIGGITARAEANATSGQVTNTRGGEFIAVSDGNNSAATHNNVIGSLSAAYAEDAAALNDLIGGSSYAYVNSNRTTDITTLTGHSSEVEINADNTYTTAYLYRGTLDINSTHTITDTYAFRYDISGTSAATNNWGIYIDDVDKNYVSGKLGIGTGSPGESLTISGKVLSYGGTGTVGAGTSYFLGNSNNSRDIALTRVDSGALGIGRYNSGWLETMRFTIGGDVGIGTTSPAAKLDVSGGSLKVQSGDTFGYDGTHAAIYMDNSNGRGLSGKFGGSGYARNLIKSNGSSTIQIGENTSLISRILLDAGSTSANGYISLQTNQSERVRIANDGDVGIGITSPETKLHIYENAAAPVLLTLNNYQGDINPNGSQGNFIDFKMTDDNNTFTPQVRIGMIVKDSDGDSGLISEGCGNFVVYTGEGTDQGGSGTLTEHFRITDKGKVGIGTTSPSEALHIYRNAASAEIRLQNNTISSYVRSNTDNLNFYVSNGEKMRITTAGNVGIGTTSPASKLDVAGDIAISGTAVLKKSSNKLEIGDIAGADGITNIELNSAGDSTIVFLDDGGNVGINDTSPSYALDVTGTIRATGDVIAYSDARVKENVETIPNALNKVKSMRGVGYNKIGEEKRSVGVIAQELLEVLPEAVHQDESGMYSVAYGNIVGVLIESIKELENRVEALEQKIKQNGITE